ncbi:MAG TPA: 3-phosphoshikimate 1-carboxyvinyltransferase [Vicinamibacteria bacterium]|nr:3-phosphoshikimate 1-carboxyvinyltransferase [Vicinamibacteria bacterium]
MRLTAASRFRGRFVLPGDKSLCHRLALLGALAEGETRIDNFSTAADCDSTLRCLGLLGVESTRQGGTVSIRGPGWRALAAAPGPLPAGNSGSTLRMLAGILAACPFRSTITGDASLCRRPVERVARPLRAMGAQVETVDGRPPLAVTGGPLKGVDWPLDVPSAQVKTAVLLAGLFADGATRTSETRPSRDHTERLLPAFGVAVEVAADGAVAVRGREEPLRALVWSAPGDVSSAAFLVVAALIRPHSHVRVDGVLLNPRRTAFLDVLRAMGADVEWQVQAAAPEPTGWIEARSSRLHGTDVPAALVPALIDEVPALVVAAACAEGTTRFAGAAELRVKESDRIAAMAGGLQRMGVQVVEQPDGLTVTGGAPLQGAHVRSHGDHRIAMALAVAALAARGETRIEEAECASVSFPEFYEVLRRGVEGA